MILGDFRNKTCIFGVENNFIPFFHCKKKTQQILHLLSKKIRKKKVSTCCYRPRGRLKHSVSGHGYNDYIGVWADIWCCETRILTSSNISHPFHMPQCSWKALREENATPPPVHPHQNTWKFKKCQGSFKIKLCSRFQKKISARLHVSFLSGKTRKKAVYQAKWGIPIFSIVAPFFLSF